MICKSLQLQILEAEARLTMAEHYRNPYPRQFFLCYSPELQPVIFEGNFTLAFLTLFFKGDSLEAVEFLEGFLTKNCVYNIVTMATGFSADDL